MEAALRDYSNSLNTAVSQWSSASDYRAPASIWGGRGGWRKRRGALCSSQLPPRSCPQSHVLRAAAAAADRVPASSTVSDSGRCRGCRGYAALWEHTLRIHSVCHADYMVVFIPGSPERRTKMQVSLLFVCLAACRCQGDLRNRKEQ